LAEALDEPERSERLGWGLKIIVDNDNATLEHFHLDRVGPDDRCRFLEDGGDCEMHNRFGTAALPDLCVNFPSIPYDMGPHVELHWDTVCPAVLDVLADDDVDYLPTTLDTDARPDLAVRAISPLTRPPLALGSNEIPWDALQTIRRTLLNALTDTARPTIEHICAISYSFARLRSTGDISEFAVRYDDPPELFYEFLEESASANAPKLLAWRWDRYKRFVWGFDRDHSGLENLEAFFDDWADPLQEFMVDSEPDLRPLLNRYLAHRYFSVFVRSQGRMRFAWGSIPHAYALAIRTAAALSGCLERATDVEIMKAALGFADYHYRGLRIPPDALPWFTPFPHDEEGAPTAPHEPSEHETM